MTPPVLLTGMTLSHRFNHWQAMRSVLEVRTKDSQEIALIKARLEEEEVSFGLVPSAAAAGG